ncbi:MAG: lipid II:glycine glycyltransferase FemX [Anaerolineae bacterium]|jgi:lipid II:glycine glycyltransferase (peptidoglycan interpeptide bridge formation enzyme)
MQARIVEGAADWDRALLALPAPHVLQSWTWGAFKARHGWQAMPLLFEDAGEPVAAAMVLRRKLLRRDLPLLPLSVLYVPRGPALDWHDAALARGVLAELEHLARRQRAILVKIDPDVYHPEGAPAFAGRPACAPQVADLFRARGWQPSMQQIQFANTVLLDLEPSEEDLLAGMKQKSRYNTRLARRRGVTVRSGTSADDLALFYSLYAETAERDGFPIRPREYYLDAWSSFLDVGGLRLLLAEVEGETVAGLILLTFGPTAWYMYGASSDRHRERMPNNLLQWEAIRQARAAGCRLYDLWGAPDRLDDADPMWGVYRFKLGLGGELARGLGAWDFPARPLLYRIYLDIIPRYLDVLHRRAVG